MTNHITDPTTPHTEPLTRRFNPGARGASLLAVAVLALFPVAYAVRSTAAGQPPAGQKKDGKPEEPKKDGKQEPGQTKDAQPPAPTKSEGPPAGKAGGRAKADTMTGPADLRIGLDSPAAVLARAKELGLEDKQRKELEKLDQSAREQARAVLTEKQRQQLNEIPPEWLALMQMGQTPADRGGQGGMGPDMMRQMMQMMMMRQMMQMMDSGGGGQGGGQGQGGGGMGPDMMRQMMQMMMGQGGGGMGGMGQGAAGPDMMRQMMQMMMMRQMMQMMDSGGG
ncbi:MAG: hypothetical protein K2X87_30325, partial [Gemmataceae bacterium]|nr:hypothetical protein [Gemmataceae bacterium]